MKPQLKKQVIATSPIKVGEVVSPQKVEFDSSLVKNAVDQLNTKELTSILQSAFNVSENLNKWLPKLAKEVAQKIREYNATLNEKSIKLKVRKK